MLRSSVCFFLFILFLAVDAKAQYCTPTYLNGCFNPGLTNDLIDDFQITNAVTNISNMNTGCNMLPDNYIYYNSAALTASVAQGCSFDFSLQCGITYAQGFGIWIDFNNNNNFNDPGEFVWNSGFAGFNIFTGTVSIPASTTLGIKRMRVRCNYNTPPVSPCANQTYGETEDYNLNIVPSANTPPTASNVSICNGQSALLTATASGTIQWFTVPVGGFPIQNGPNFQTPVLNSTTTYFVQTTSGGCTSPRVPVTVTVTAGFPLIIFANEDSVCSGGSVTLIASSGNSFLWGPAAVLSSTTNDTVVATLYSPTLITLTATNAQGCSVNASYTVHIRPGPNPVIASSANPICEGSSAQLNASGGVAFSWSPSTGLSSTTGSSVSCAPLFTTTYTLVVTDASGCTASVNHQQIVNPLPFVNAGPDQTICVGSSASLSGSGTGSFSWTPAGLVSQNNLANPSVNPTTGTMFYLTLTDGNGCQATDSAYVSVNPIPIANAGSNLSFCPGGSTSLNGSGGLNYSWSPSTGLSNPTIANPVANPSSTTTYNLIVTDANGCVSANNAQTTVTVFNQPPPPLINVSGPLTFCQGGNVQLSSSIPSNTLWSNGATTQSITVNASGTFNLSYIDANGCTSAVSAPVTITVNGPPANPAVVAGGPLGFCPGGSVSLTAPSGYSYAWSTGSNAQTISVSASGTYSVTITDANGCSAGSAPQTVTVFSPPNAPAISLSGSSSICPGGTVTLSVPGGFASYLWSNGQTSSSIVVNSAGTYSVQITDINGCISPASNQSILVYPNPVAPTITASSAVVFCQGGSVTLSAPPASSYLWSNGSAASSITVNASGSYTVDLIDLNGCVAPPSSPILVTALPLPAPPAISASGPLSFCSGGSVTLTATPSSSVLWSNGSTGASIQVTTSGTYTAVFTDANGCTSFASTPTFITVNPLAPAPLINASGPTQFCSGDSVVLSCSPAQSYTWSTGETTQSIVVNQTGLYTVNITSVCMPSNPVANATITVWPLPDATFSFSPEIICVPDAVTFQYTGSSSGSLLWTFDDGGSSDALMPVYGYLFPGEYEPSLSITDVNGCTASSTSGNKVKVFSKPFIHVGIDPKQSDLDNNLISVINLTPGLNNIAWSVNGVDQSIENRFQYRAQEPGSYVIMMEAVTEDGCPVSFTDSVQINEAHRFFAPNAFTPNGDNFNDEFAPRFEGILENTYELRVYDRWGNAIFKTREFKGTWDGIGFPDGVYIWEVTARRLNGNVVNYKGSVTLLR